MTLDANKALMRRFYDEFWCKGNPDAVDELVAPGFTDHQLPPGMQPGPEGLKQLVREWRTGFPDMHEEVDMIFAEGDLVSGRFVLTGTHLGPFFGIAPTGRKVKITGIDIVRIRDGRITDFWYSEDQLSLLRQLGQIPNEPMPAPQAE